VRTRIGNLLREGGKLKAKRVVLQIGFQTIVAGCSQVRAVVALKTSMHDEKRLLAIYNMFQRSRAARSVSGKASFLPLITLKKAAS
jgi:hypothetical protein